MRVKHVKVSAVKNKYYIKNTAAAGVGFTTAGVWSVCVYIFYTARGDQVKYNSLFGCVSYIYLCLYNQLFARFHYVFRFLTL